MKNLPPLSVVCKKTLGLEIDAVFVIADAMDGSGSLELPAGMLVDKRMQHRRLPQATFALRDSISFMWEATNGPCSVQTIWDGHQQPSSCSSS